MPSFLNSLFGSKPTVPTLPTLNLGTEQQLATQGNLNELPGAEQMVGKANQFNRDQITQMLQSIIPGYSGMVSSATSNIASELQGQVPNDVSAQVQDSAAAKALGGGYGGSGAHGDLVARDLGLTSLNLTQQGLSSFESWTQMSDALYAPSQINVQSMFVTPQQQASFDNQQNMDQFQRQWMQNQIDAMPDPVTKGIWDFTIGGVHDLIAGKAGSTNWGSFGAGASSSAASNGAAADFGGELSASSGPSTAAGSGGL